jgi:hypothetical protein
MNIVINVLMYSSPKQVLWLCMGEQSFHCVIWIYDINYIKNELSCCTCYKNRGPRDSVENANEGHLHNLPYISCLRQRLILSRDI